MATFNSFTEIIAWQKARELSVLIYELTSKGSFSRDFGLKDQINQATGSIMDNIAEGHGRGSKSEFINFLTYARGSAEETLSQAFRATDRRHISDDQFKNIQSKIEELGKMITRLITYLNTTTIRGIKFKDRI